MGATPCSAGATNGTARFRRDARRISSARYRQLVLAQRLAQLDLGRRHVALVHG